MTDTTSLNFCALCGSKLDAAANFCENCGSAINKSAPSTQERATSSPSAQPITEQSSAGLKAQEWYERTWIVIAVLILFWPGGLYLLWRNPHIRRSRKVITSLLVFITLVIIGVVFIEKIAHEMGSISDGSSSSQAPSTPLLSADMHTKEQQEDDPAHIAEYAYPKGADGCPSPSYIFPGITSTMSPIERLRRCKTNANAFCSMGAAQVESAKKGCDSLWGGTANTNSQPPTAPAQVIDFASPSQVFIGIEGIRQECLSQSNNRCALICQQYQKTIMQINEALTGSYDIDPATREQQYISTFHQYYDACSALDQASLNSSNTTVEATQAQQSSVPSTLNGAASSQPAAAQISSLFTPNHQVHFVDGTAEDRAQFQNVPSVKELVQGNFLIAYEDLKGDGTKEVILTSTSSNFCGASGGCETVVLERSGNQYATLLDLNLDTPLAVTDEKVGGYANLAMVDDAGKILVDNQSGTPMFGKQMVYPMKP